MVTKPSSSKATSGRKNLSWAAMLAWILLAFVIAGLIAWRLTAPFFHHG
jgi:hypothetical protein